MNIPRIISQISFGSGYPLGPGGHWNHVTFTGAPGPYKTCPEVDGTNPFYYPGYPGMIPEPDGGRNPFGGILNHPHKLNYLA